MDTYLELDDDNVISIEYVRATRTLEAVRMRRIERQQADKKRRDEAKQADERKQHNDAIIKQLGLKRRK